MLSLWGRAARNRASRNIRRCPTIGETPPPAFLSVQIVRADLLAREPLEEINVTRKAARPEIRMPLSSDEGRAAVRLARETLESHVRGGSRERGVRRSGALAEKRGVFVTLNTLEGGTKQLRGCIGYPEPIKPLWEAVQDVTIYASEDPRFPFPVRGEELDSIVVEVSVLTLPQEVHASRRQELPSKIRLGVDGLIISTSFTSGLFLPQVATEQGWDQETFMSEACGKAGLPFDSWLRDDTKVQTFQAEVFAEVSPRGDVVRLETPVA